MDFGYYPLILKCKCNKEFLVEQVMFGINHAISIVVTCKDCIDLPLKNEFINKHPEEAEMIIDWKTLPLEEFEQKQEDKKKSKIKESLLKYNPSDVVERLMNELKKE